MRKERVLAIVRQCAASGRSQGVSAEEVAKLAGIHRHNASADLNELVRDGVLTKIVGRPVLFRPADTDDAVSAKSSEQAGAANVQTSCFDRMIGADGSLRTAVEQAKAAILYPPRGLPMLILGPTGSGKSYLAEMVYRYAVEVGRLGPDAPFNVFNCADYASNPQLLFAQLFGYVKGAFTGADRTSPGLIAESDNGVLFLDEIHRLPPDGQEMLFLFMDRGVYRMLGDGAVQRRASVTLIAATSEDPHSALLKTLLRRFPVSIALPDLDRRPMSERLGLIETFLREEASRIGFPISVSPLVLVALLTFRTSGNVGELQSAVLLGCAKAFLHHVATGASGPMALYLTHLAPHIQLEYLRNHQATRKAEQLVGVEDRLYVPDRVPASPKFGGEGKFADLYRDLSRRVNGYLESGLEPGEVQKLIQIDLDYYWRRLLGKMDGNEQLSPRFLTVVGEFVARAGRELGCEFGPEVTTGIALHLASAPWEEPVRAEKTLTMIAHCSREYGVVRRLAHLLEDGLKLTLSPEQAGFLALFLAAHGRKTDDAGKVYVMVIAHGERTASSMADVANSLVVEKRVTAIDMPLDQSVEHTLQLAAQRIRELGNVKGILLLVDMGSLTGFDVALERSVGVPVALVPYVTTPAVIEAARLAGTGDLHQMAQAVKQVYNFEHSAPQQKEAKPLIITTCLSGQGTARKLAAFLNEALPDDIRRDVIVRPVDMSDGSEMPGLFVEGWRGTVVAAVGTVDPRLPGVTFIGMEQVLFGNGMQSLIAKIRDGRAAEPAPVFRSGEEAVALACRFAADSIGLPEGKRYAEAAERSLRRLKDYSGRELTPGQSVRWIIHLAFALERIGADGPVAECAEMAELEQRHRLLIEVIQQSVAEGTEGLPFTLPRSEIGLLAQIVLSE